MSPVIHDRRRRSRAFTIIEFLIVVSTIAFVALVFVSLQVLRPRAMRIQPSCQNNLKQIGLAFRTWEGDYADRYPMTVPISQGGSMERVAGSNLFRHFSVMSNEINNPRLLNCPTDDRKPAVDFDHLSNSNLSYFVCLDADETLPSMWLTGDRNLVANGVLFAPGLVTITTNTNVGWSKKMHNRVGMVGLADGSVQQTTSQTVNALLQYTRTNLIRLAVP
jgi:type II secretory pathway pseudopilin PulG